MNRRDFARALAAGGGLALAATRAVAQPGAGPMTPSTPWPTGALKGDAAAVERAWTRASDGSLPATGRTDALVIVQDGRLVFQRYGRDHGPGVRHVSWSMGKSITHALVGIAVLDGKVDIDAPLRTLPRPHPGLTLRRLLTLTDGLAWDEASYSPVSSDATRMLYGVGRLDGAAYTAAKPQAVPPGARWNYSTGAFQLAAAELQAALFPNAHGPAARRAAMAGWIRARLFAPLGMDAVAEFDPAGTFYGGSLVYASAPDFARFGQLYLQDGVWAGRRLLPEGWVRFARTPTRSPAYGAGFWLETAPGAPSVADTLMRGAGPRDAFSAQGHDGQITLIVPSRRLVVVRLGLMPDDPPNWAALGGWMAGVVKAVA